MADITLREVILVSTKTINIDTSDSRMPDANAPINQGQKEVIEVPNHTAEIEQASGVSITTGTTMAPPQTPDNIENIPPVEPPT